MIVAAKMKVSGTANVGRSRVAGKARGMSSGAAKRTPNAAGGTNRGRVAPAPRSGKVVGKPAGQASARGKATVGMRRAQTRTRSK